MAKEFELGKPIPRVKLPRLEPVTAHELERRAKAVDRILELRKKIGTIGISAEELVREAREEAEQRA